MRYAGFIGALVAQPAPPPPPPSPWALFDEGASDPAIEFSTISDGGHSWRLAEIPSTANIVLSRGGKVEYLIVAPGGPGGNARFAGGGGGSAGDVLIGEVERDAGSYPAVVAPGVPAPSASENPNSYAPTGTTGIFGLVAQPGGYGGGRNGNTAPGTSNSGHYAASNGGGGIGMSDQFPAAFRLRAAHQTTFSGGDGVRINPTSGRAGGGGRGAAGDGQDAETDLPGAGGPGVTTTFTGVSRTFGRGGDGGNAELNRNGTAGENPGDGGEGASSPSPQRLGGGTLDGVIFLRVRSA
jgi:hypothetical protein